MSGQSRQTASVVPKVRSTERVNRLIQQAIERFELDLEGLTVLTEAATGYYSATPIIAALAGASHVIALGADSRFGTIGDAATQIQSLKDACGIAAAAVEIITCRSPKHISRADIITNLGHVRPIDATLLTAAKPTAAIPLMWETWEHRPEDLELEACGRRGNPVLGTDEHHPALGTLRYVGHLALKLLLELDVETLGSEVGVAGGDEFAQSVVDVLASTGNKVHRLWPPEDLARCAAEMLPACDALVIAEHHDRRQLVGRDGYISFADVKRLNPSISIAHIAGGADWQEVHDVGLPCFPAAFAPAGRMSVDTSYLGPRPLIDLHTAGLRVGEALTRARLRGLSRQEAEEYVLGEVPFAQAFGRAAEEERLTWDS